MKIVINKQELEKTCCQFVAIPEIICFLDHYLDGAIEAEADAIYDGGKMCIS
jgi:carbamoyl-phosphate synthase large subunit